MRILLVHNFYRSNVPSGENTVYMSEKTLLQNAGHQVFEFTRTNDEYIEAPVRTALEAALLTPWNPLTNRKFQKALDEATPDVIHVHNTFPLISPSIFWAAHNHRAAVVLTLHNYRIFCAAAIAMRDGKPCMKCLEQASVKPAITHRCYRQSRIATLPVVGMIALHHRLKTWGRMVDAFIAMSEFQRNKMVEAGLPTEKIRIKPHFTSPASNWIPWQKRENKLLFIGRLTEEKGADLLLQALCEWPGEPPVVEIIGDGPQRAQLEAFTSANNLVRNVHFLGLLEPAAVRQKLASARLLVLPSRCLETFGMPVIEAYAQGVPVLAPRLGPFSDLVRQGETGMLFEAADSASLRARLHELWRDSNALARMSDEALITYQRNYSPEANLAILTDIYLGALGQQSQRRTPA